MPHHHTPPHQLHGHRLLPQLMPHPQEAMQDGCLLLPPSLIDRQVRLNKGHASGLLLLLCSVWLSWGMWVGGSEKEFTPTLGLLIYVISIKLIRKMFYIAR